MPETPKDEGARLREALRRDAELDSGAVVGIGHGEVMEALREVVEQGPLTEAQREELRRRIADYEADPEAGSTWEDVKGRLQGRPDPGTPP